MRIDSIDLSQMHRMAREAVEAMLIQAKQCDCGMNEYFEDQLMHEICCRFRPGYPSKRKPSISPWVKYTYPDGRKRTDVLVEGMDHDGKLHQIWIEIKYKKYGNYSDPGLGNFQQAWQSDLDKLRKLRNSKTLMQHGYWIWAYAFCNYKDEIIQKFGNANKWKRPMALSSMATFLQDCETGSRRKLGQTLASIDKEFKNGAVCSIKPSLGLNNYSDYSVLIISAQAK